MISYPPEPDERRYRREADCAAFRETFKDAYMDEGEARRDHEYHRCVNQCKLAIREALTRGEMNRQAATDLVARLDGGGSAALWDAETWLRLPHTLREYAHPVTREWYRVEYY